MSLSPGTFWPGHQSAVALGAALAAVGVALGAFGAHALRAMVSPERLQTWDTAVEYHLVHALGLIAVGMVARHSGHGKLLRASALLFLVGIVLFSGSLYTLVLTDLSRLGLVTPLGGLAFIAGWLVLAFTMTKASSKPDNAQHQEPE